jgi:hypothetical protein
MSITCQTNSKIMKESLVSTWLALLTMRIKRI